MKSPIIEGTLRDGRLPFVQCPFCPGAFRDAADDRGPVALLHTFPSCERFDTLPVDEFLHAVNEELGNIEYS